MPGRLLRVALLALLVALVLPAASRTFPTDKSVSHRHGPAPLAICTGGTACIDLDVHQGDTPDPIPAGNTLTYRITLQNHGPDAATDVTVLDTLPPNTTCVSVTATGDPAPATGPACSPTNGACSLNSFSNTVDCFFATVENTDLNPTPGPRVIIVKVTPDPTNPPPAYPRTITNTVEANNDCTCTDSNAANDRSLENTTVNSPGELRLTKSHVGDPVPPSNVMTYDLRIENTAQAATLSPPPPAGTGTQPNPITVTDTLPHGFEFVGTTAAVDQCTATPAGPLQNSIVTCNPQVSIPGTLDPTTGLVGPPGSYTIHLQVEPIQTGSFVNLATVSKYGGEVNTSDNSASDPTRVVCPKPGTVRVPFLCVTKTDSQDPVPEGMPFNYTIRVTNERNGVNDAFTGPVRVTDTLPPGMTVVATAVQGGSCGQVSGGVLACTINPDILPASTRTITVTLIALQVGTFENVACVDIPDVLFTCANQPTTIIPAADLMITKTAAPNPVDVNTNVTYTIKVTNKGPAGVPNVQMDDSIPGNVQFVSSTVSPGTAVCALATAANFHCNLGFMAPLTSKTVTVIAKSTAAGTITNKACVANDGTAQAPVDFDLTNNCATSTDQARDADLAVTKTAAPSPLGVGQPLTYTMTVTNNGPGVASGVALTDPLPDAVTFKSSATTQGTCAGSTTITCSIGTLAPAAVATVTIVVNPTKPGTAKNTVTVTSDSSDPTPANNTASATVTVTAADVSITKTASPDPVAFGTPLTYTLRVTNHGPDKATGVTVHDALPAALAVPTLTQSQGTCFGAPNVTCVLGDLAVNKTATVTIVATELGTAGSITNGASVTSAFDLNSSNNSASVTTRVINPQVVATPAIGTPGFVTVASGTDFPPNAPVELTWQPGLGRQTVTAGADGTFSVPMLVFPNDTIGPRQIVATPLQPQVPATDFLTTDNAFRVVAPTSQPFQVEPQVPTTQIVQRSG
jgi:large repetitive protein